MKKSNKLILFILILAMVVVNFNYPAQKIKAETGSGLLGTYFNEQTLTNQALSRVDPTLNFNWGTGSPSPLIGSDTYSIRWTGKIQPLYSQTYTFYITSDDGTRLWVNNQLIIDNWTDHPATENNGNISLTAGVMYDIKIEYYESVGGASFTFEWSSPSQPRQIVPQSQLYPFIGNGTGLAGTYFNNSDLTNNVLARTDSTINFNWGTGSPSSSIGADTFSVRWVGKIQPLYSEMYTLYTTSDDGIRLWINNQLLIDNWTDHAPTENSAKISFIAGIKYDIKIEYYENVGGTTCSLEWSSASQTRAIVPQSQLYSDLGTGTGLAGLYFNASNFTNYILTRTDSSINFNWGTNSPNSTLMDADSFSIRWAGMIQPLYSQTYTFYTTSDDGIRLWVNDQLIINNWTDHAATVDTGTINLSAGVKYNIKLEYYDSTGGATCVLEWSSSSQVRQVIPQSQLYATSNGNSPQSEVYSNDFVAVDGANRALPTYDQVGPIKPNKYVGVFYWLWHGYVRTNPILDVTQVLLQNPNNPVWAFQDYFWGEPEANYYHSQDQWVQRRNLIMMANAGVDFIYIDFTNGTTGSEALSTLCNVATELRNQGINVPYIVFFVNSNQDTTVNWLYDNIYSQGLYQNLWFYWEGKPLIMAGAGQGNVSQTIKDFFTWKTTWAFQSETQNQWRFIDDYPQRYSWETDPLVPEQICVSKAMGAPLVAKTAINNKGASYHNGIVPQYNQYWVCDQTPLGLFFQEQWDRALSINPTIITVTGWNELTAGAWNMDYSTATYYNFMGKPLEQDPNRWYFVDEFNAEFNRDIEPMKGGYTDNYYYQLVANIRRFKGMNPSQPSSGTKTINVDGNFSDWANVYPIYKDNQGDTLHRNFRNTNNSETYINNTGRNDIIESRVSCDASYVYFYVKTAANITSYTSNNWMLLYIDCDNNKATGWNGYDYVLNSNVVDSNNSVLKWWNNNQWNVVHTSIQYRVNGNQMELALPRININQVVSAVSLSYHIVDNVSFTSSFEDTFINGDSAPDRRFNYKYDAYVAYQ